MELEKVHQLLKVIALARTKPGDSGELDALRNISLALMYIADAIAEIQKSLAAPTARSR